MKIFVYFLIGASSILMTFSCSRNNTRYEVGRFLNSEIIFPQSLKANDMNLEYIEPGLSDKDLKLIIWYDSVGCNQCRLNKLHLWSDILIKSLRYAQKMDIIFILSPTIEDYQLIYTLKSQSLDVKYIIDREYLFSKNNPQIPRDQRFHVFLVDKNNKVALAGDPRDNVKLWTMYEENIQELISNGGYLNEHTNKMVVI